MRNTILVLAILAFLSTSVAFAGTVTIYPTSPEVASSSSVGASGNSAPGFGTGSVANNGSSTKSEIYIPVAELFTGAVSIRVRLHFLLDEQARSGGRSGLEFLPLYQHHRRR